MTSEGEPGQQACFERDRLAAETRKIQLEADEIQRRLEQPWFSPRRLLEALIGGIIGATTMYGWFMSWAPLMEAKSEEAKYRHQAYEARSELREQQLLGEIVQLRAENVSLRNQVASEAPSAEASAAQQGVEPGAE